MSSSVPSTSSVPPTSPFKTITEGSTTMVYPADEESTVFYNPVQVQNRDLSTLMIALYVERRRRRIAWADKKKELRANQIKGEELQRQLEQFDKELDIAQLIQRDNSMHYADTTSTSTTTTTRGIHILDALAASGLRSIRYWKEIPGVEHVTINDLDPVAVERAHANMKQNSLEHVVVSTRDRGVRIQHANAMDVLYASRQVPVQPQQQPHLPVPDQLQRSFQYNIIDLDPYGSAAPFLDGAIQAIADGGMLNVTCTDMAALGGSHPETAFGRYGSLPIQRANYLHEVALRILLKALAQTAAKYGRTIRPILSVGMDFYIRCFVEVFDDKAGVHDLSLHIGSVYQSTHCSTFLTVPHGKHGKNHHVFQSTRAPSHCEETGAPFKVGGPMWLGPLHDVTVVHEALARLAGKNMSAGGLDIDLLATRRRLEGLLTVVSEELQDVPLYYSLPDLCHVLNCQSPPLVQFKAAIANAGYRVSGFHKEPQAIKTDAPPRIVWDVMRAWCKDNPPKISKKKLEKRRKKKETDTPISSSEGEACTNMNDDDADILYEQPSAADKILAIEPSIQVDFAIPKGGNSQKKVIRFPMNPEKNWGPKKAASSGKRKHEMMEEPQQPED